MNNDHLLYLLDQVRRHQASAEELEELMLLVTSDEPSPFFDQLHEFHTTNQDKIARNFNESSWDDMVTRVLQSDTIARQFDTPVSSPYMTMIPWFKSVWFKAAAAIIVCFGLGAYMWLTHGKAKPAITAGAKVPGNILPGGNRAVLTLADGTKIVLDSAGNGTLARQGNAQVVKSANGQIIYNLHGETSGEVMLNTMSTPKGGQYQLLLPDGTRVWLNAASSITYPAAFAGTDRKVTISGEAYFDVAPDEARPFTVAVANKVLVEVLGTSFNINAYADEPGIRATLARGSVKVSRQQITSSPDKQSVLLKPGQQAETVTADNIIKVNDKADLEEAFAWKNGYFQFTRANLQYVMRQLSRWYDVEVVYEGRMPDRHFGGRLLRHASLEEMLKVLQTYNVNFRLEGKRITVTSAENKKNN